MGGEQELSGPDLAQGIPFSDLEDGWGNTWYPEKCSLGPMARSETQRAETPSLDEVNRFLLHFLVGERC